MQKTLSMLLVDEIEKQHIKVAELVQRSTVTIQGDNLFSSGSTTVNRSLIPLLHRIADAICDIGGLIPKICLKTGSDSLFS
jgi:type VI secretion system protein ImpK